MIRIVFFLLLFLATYSCQQKEQLLVVNYQFPKKLKEVSGISYTSANHLLWAIEDSGNPNMIYGLDTNGKIQNKISVSGTQNVDWEDITSDQEGNLYLGDFGNNDNTRKDLCIYKIEKGTLESKSTLPKYKIAFFYPEQKDFPPKKKELLYDVESFFEFKNNFYLFTKNRSKGFDGTSLLYKVPNVAGNHQAMLIGRFNTCDTYNNCAITSAAISPDHSKVVVLSHSKVWLFENFNNDDFLSGTIREFNLDHYSQKEAICFKDNETLQIADEKVKNTGGFVYEISLNALKLETKP